MTKPNKLGENTNSTAIEPSTHATLMAITARTPPRGMVSSWTEFGMVSLFGVTTLFGMPQDVTLDELAIESFFPADADSAALLARI
jgi:hypothetical protein